jgi:hypothetical protein
MIKYKISLSKNIFDQYFLILLIIYISFQVFIFANTLSMVPDELNYIGVSHGFSLLDRQPPPIDYGSIYWFLLKIFHYKILIRLVFLLFFITPVLLIPILIEDKIGRLIYFLLYISFPYAFWTGKLVGPEILIVFICTLSLLCLKYRKLKLSNVLLGLGLGIKITIVPFILFYYLLLILKVIVPAKKFPIYILYFALGLWLSNPLNIDLYLMHLTSSSNVSGDISSGILNKISLEKIGANLFSLNWAWDNVMLGSFSQMFLNPLLLVILTFVLFQKNNKLNIIIFYAFFVVSIILTSSTNTMYVWYWFPFIPALIVCFSDYKISCINSGKTRALIFLLVLIVGFNSYKNIIYTSRQISEKMSSIEFYRGLNETEACLRNSIPNIESKVIINKLDFGYRTKKLFPTHTEKLHLGSEIGDEPTIILFSRNNIQNPYNLESLGKKVKLNYYGSCSDQVFIFYSD